MDENIFKIGTRNSPLAMVQAHLLKDALQLAHPDLQVELVPVLSKADWKKTEGEKPLSEEAGGKGLFAKEIETSLLNSEIDCGVHSLKDMASFLPEGLVIDHVLPRANAMDAFISAKYQSVKDLPEGATIGSCSARRAAIILSTRPDVKVLPFRGNVQTRLDKIEAGQVDATFLAQAGLERLSIQSDMVHPLSAEEMLPACGQGIICMETRSGDARAHDILNQVHCIKTGFCAFAEREVLRALDGSCHTPIAAFAEIIGEHLNLRAEVYALDGSAVFKQSLSEVCINAVDAVETGKRVGSELNNAVPKGFML